MNINTVAAAELYVDYIYVKAEREKFEQDRANFSDSIVQAYDAATTYHDGKWLMIELQDERLFTHLKKLLYLKRKPNK